MTELDRQIALLLDDAVAPHAGGRELAGQLARLREQLARLEPHGGAGNVPVCIAVRAPSVAGIMSRIEARNARGVVDMTPCSPDEFHPIEGLELPASDVYALIDVDTGRARLNMTPEESLAAIRAEGRTPLTLEEGVVLALVVPALLTDKQRYNCIQMAGSRRAGDQRVPSIWLSKGAPRLGWCWDRNPHTWLATASAARRVGLA